MTKTTFIATCPITGKARTRKSAHSYTHALTVKRTMVAKPIEGTFIMMKSCNVPAGYVLVRRPGAAVWGSACKTVEVPAEEQVTEILSLISFHESEELARKSSGQYACGGLYRVEAIPIPCSLV